MIKNIIVHYDVNVTKYSVKCGTLLRFWENKGWINSLDPYGWFQWYFRGWLGRRSLDDKSQVAKWKGIVNRFKGKLVTFDDYSISPKIRQFYCIWDYELVENHLL